MKRNSLIISLLIILYLVSRLINLNKLPIFNDEAMYLNWGRLIAQNPKENLFISLTDGQQPFFLWLTAISYLFGGKNPLLAGRLISVISGFGTTIVLFFIGKDFLGKKWNVLLPILYIISPFTLLYDRLSIKDSFLTFLASLIFYFSIKKDNFNKLKQSLFIGLVLGIALLTKSIAYFFIGLYLLTTLIFFKKYNFKNLKANLPKIFLTLIIAFITQALMSYSPLIKNIGLKNSVFLLSFPEFVKNPFSLFRNNLYSTIIWWWQYYHLLIVLGITGWVYLFFKNKKLWILLNLWVGLPIVFEIFLAKIYIPRYFLFTFIAFSILVGFGIKLYFSRLKSKILKIVILILLLSPNLLLDWQILFNIEGARLPQVERWQYLEGWPAGYGVEDLIIFFKTKTKEGTVNIITEKETLISDSLNLYLGSETNFKLIKVFDLEKELYFPREYLDLRVDNFIILNHFEGVPEDWPVEKVASFPRIGGKRHILVYLINPQ